MIETVKIHNMVLHSKVLGPGNRSVIWFQGCQRRCKGCMSESTRPIDGGKEVPVDLVLEEVKKLNDIEGITISGGEPFLQINALYSILKNLRETTKLGVIIYTGYTMEQLHTMQDIKVDSILTGYADLIIDGEYIDELNDGKSLKGSSNQKLNFITERYKKFLPIYEEKKRNIEIYATSRDLFIVGVPEKGKLEELRKSSEELPGDKKDQE